MPPQPSRREVVSAVLEGRRPPYVPWSFGFTVEAAQKLRRHYGADDLSAALGDHLLWLGAPEGFYEDIGGERVRDVWGVVWDRSIDRDIGTPVGRVLEEPSLDGFEVPDPLDERFYAAIEERIAAGPERFRVFPIGFSLYERAWTLRGMERLMMDFHDNPDFVRELLDTLADFNIARARRAADYDIDAVYFGDDWGQQRGLQMGPRIWHEFLRPPLERMYGAVREMGKYVFIHSCGDVDELFDDLIAMGVNCFNPFQPEVMDVESLMRRYRGRLVFHGGLSTQRTLPRGTPKQVRAETRRLLELGREGGYIFAPAHAVEGDVPLQNMLAFIEEVQNQPA